MNLLASRFYNFFGLEFEFDNVAFYIGDKGIYWYGIIISLGFILALIYCSVRAPKLNVDKDKMIDVVIVGLIASIIGARLYYVLFDWLGGNPYNSFLDVIAIWDGGIAIYGGFIFAIVFGGIMCKVKKIHLLDMFDLAVMGFFIGQGLGRWGNFINQEVYGRETGSAWFGIGVEPNTSVLVHPLFLYESLLCLLGFLLLHFVSKRRQFKGQLFSLYLIWYCSGRFILEGMRDTTYILKLGPFAASQIVSILLFALGVTLYIVFSKKYSLKAEGEYESIYIGDEQEEQETEEQTEQTELTEETEEE